MWNKLNPPSLRTVVCRPARQADTSDVLELTRTIWDGQDYIPSVWQEWLADPLGRLVVAQHGRRVVGLAKLTFLFQDQWWLEGLRVDPAFQREGIATHIFTYLMETWREIGSGVVRLDTSSRRIAVHRLCAKNGFTKIGEFDQFDAVPLRDQPDKFTPIQPGEETLAMQLVAEPDTRIINQSLMNAGWKFCQPCLEAFRAAINDPLVRAWWWRDQKGLLLTFDDQDDGRSILACQFLVCRKEQLGEFLLDFRRLAHRSEKQEISWLASVGEELKPGLALAGFKRSTVWNDLLWVFEYSRPTGEVK